MADGDGDGDGDALYVISDLHIGGDEQLEQVEFIDELLGLLERLESEGAKELIINGDAFGLWEFTTIDGPAKFDALRETYPELFAQLRATGESVQITLVPGNHDYELAAYEEYVDRFAEYNVDLVQEESITREVGGRVVWFEHGHQHDPNNKIENFGNPGERPLGYYFNTHVTSRAGQASDRGRARYSWLKDIQAVTPTERIPVWLTSKYFYREMNPLIRYAFVPFLLMFNISVVLAILAGLDLAGIWSAPVELIQRGLRTFGQAGSTAYVLFGMNVAIVGVLMLVWIPLRFLIDDVRKTLNRFELFEGDLTVDPDATYDDAARAVFDDHPEVAVFCYGHTHRPKLDVLEDRLVVNTGTWLKRFHRREAVAGRLPAVFYPSYQLYAVRIEPADGDWPGEEAGAGVAVTFEPITKPSPSGEELTRTERLLTLGREPDPTVPDPAVVTEDGVERTEHPEFESESEAETQSDLQPSKTRS